MTRQHQNRHRLVLLTGATGYVGGRLLEALKARRQPVRCLVRRSGTLPRDLRDAAQVAIGDALDPASLRPAMEGVDTAYYLIHSMNERGDFAERDRRAASAFQGAARDAGLRRIIYLGGLGTGRNLSQHLASRREVGRILSESGVTTVELRASIVIGSGSISFEMVRSLVERLPVMLTPRWVSTLTQPIAVDDVVAYLVAALDLDIRESVVFEIGGPDRVSYLDLLREYARQRRLRRVMIPVPLLTPWLSSLWLGLVTPLQSRVGRRLIDGVRNETVVNDDSAHQVFDVRPRGVREAIAQTLADEDRRFWKERRWETLSPQTSLRDRWRATARPRIVDSLTVSVQHPTSRVFAAISCAWGDSDWWSTSLPWRLRGFIQRLLGPVNAHAQRPGTKSLAVGEKVDYWRVEAFEPNRILRLASEMRLPGRAWLQSEVEENESGSLVRLTTIFDPLGLSGLLYWYGLYPFHRAVFSRILRDILARIEHLQEMR